MQKLCNNDIKLQYDTKNILYIQNKVIIKITSKSKIK